MTDILATQHPADILATEEMIAAMRAAKIKHFAFGGAALLAAGLLGTAAIVWAGAQRANLEALNQLVTKLGPIKVEGTVTGEVEIKSDSAVTAIVPPAPALPIVPPSSDAIKRTVTVFSTVAHGDGAITTGWVYPSGDARAPTSQYCYFVKDNNAAKDGSDIRDPLARANSPIAAAQQKYGIAFDGMFAKCQWFAKTVATDTSTATTLPLKDVQFDSNDNPGVAAFDADGGAPRERRPVTVFLHGHIEDGRAGQFESVVRAQKKAGRPIERVLITSIGGASGDEAGEGIIKAIRELPGIEVRCRDWCASMAALVFLLSSNGGPKMVDPGGQVVLHKAVADKTDLRKQDRAENNSDARRLKAIGLPETAIIRFLASTPATEAIVTADELRAAGITVL